MNSNRKNPRRAFLRGLGGVGLALPFLEYFQPRRASAAMEPFRYFIGFCGTSTGFDGGDRVVPTNEGALAGNLSRGLQPLGDLGVSDVTSVVTGLKIPWGSTPPAGGRVLQWHSTSPCPLLCGKAGDTSEELKGATSDWMVYDKIGAGTKHDVLAYRVQAAFYRGGNGTSGPRGEMSARMNGGNVERISPIYSPRLAYESLFNGFIPPDPGEADAAKALLARRKSIVDLVATDAEALHKKLGKADQLRMQRHYDELRGLEGRLNALNIPATNGCTQFTHPGDDPPVGGAVENGDTTGYSGNGAWSDEEARAKVMIDLIHMAFTCDLSRVSSLLFTWSQCFLNMNPLFGHPSDLHEIGHYSRGGGQVGQEALADGVSWHVKHFGNLVKKLRDTEATDGSNLLDHSALLLTFEGGWGYDPEMGGQGDAHSSENMIVLVAGKAGGLHTSAGKHIRKVDAHPAMVINTAMQAVGVTDDLGDVSGTIPELLT
jgi:hypothetical protein